MLVQWQDLLHKVVPYFWIGSICNALQFSYSGAMFWKPFCHGYRVLVHLWLRLDTVFADGSADVITCSAVK